MTWAGVVEQMMSELRASGPREQSYWAQQLAFGPVLVHALALGLRERAPSAAVRLALRGLGPLPEAPGLDAALLAALAGRQARALAWGRRRTLRRLLRRHGTEIVTERDRAASGGGPVMERMLRPYPLLGWRPEDPVDGGPGHDVRGGGPGTSRQSPDPHERDERAASAGTGRA